MEITKICFKCGVLKPISEYYKHLGMEDGHLGKCKTCTKLDSAKREAKIRSTPEGIEKDRERQRNKYYRLNYKDKHRPTPEKKMETTNKYKEKYPEKILAKSYSQHIISFDGLEKHHWSYNKIHYKDVLFLSKSDHNTAHRFMIYDQERMMYRTLKGVLLDSKESHEKYILSIL